MALAASTLWEARASGAPAADAGGGGWAPLTVSTFSGSDLVVDASLNTKVTSASHNFVAADVGARIYVTGGTGWTPGFYVINSVAANAATLASSPAATSTTGGVWAEVGVDYSQQNTVQVAIDNSTITTSIAANVITFTGYTPSAKDIGNVVHMLTGTNVTAGWYQVTATGATTWTVTGAAALPTSGTTTNATGNMGGALLTLAGLASAMVASNKAWITGAFTSTTSTTFPQDITPAPAAPPTTVQGYGSTRGDATHATLTLSGVTAGLTAILSSGAHGFNLIQVDVNCANLAASTAVSAGLYLRVVSCLISNFTTAGIVGASGTIEVYNCEITGGGVAATAAISAGVQADIVGCFIHDNGCDGIIATSVARIRGNLIANNSGATSDGISCDYGCDIQFNTIHNNGRYGISETSANFINHVYLNNLLTSNATAGLRASTAIPARPEYDGNAYWNNGATRTNVDAMTGQYGVNPYVNTRDVILSVSPYVGPTTGTTANFALNNTATGGAACRKAAVGGTWPNNTGTTGFADMGAVQTASGGGVGIIVPV